MRIPDSNWLQDVTGIRMLLLSNFYNRVLDPQTIWSFELLNSYAFESLFLFHDLYKFKAERLKIIASINDDRHVGIKRGWILRLILEFFRFYDRTIELLNRRLTDSS